MKVWNALGDATCVLSVEEEECMDHLFFNWKYTQAICICFFPNMTSFSIKEITNRVCNLGEEDRAKARKLLWHIMISWTWKERCSRIFGNHTHRDVNKIMNSIRREIKSYAIAYSMYRSIVVVV
ncbi:hypothetical protein LINPERPRIM_LOCUS41122 [Linum perenne]